MKRAYSFLLFMIMFVVLSGPRTVSSVLTNAGTLLYSKQILKLKTGNSARPEYYLQARYSDNAELRQARALLSHALVLSPSDQTSRWNLARIYLVIGDPKSASEFLPVADYRLSYNPFLYFDTLLAHSLALDDRGVISFVESGASPWLGWLRPISNNLVAVSYLNRAKELLRQDEYADAELNLKEALLRRPGDLYALYQLMSIALISGDQRQATTWSNQLAHFTETSLYFPDERLADLSGEAITQLIADGIWQKSVMLNVASVLAWQGFDERGTERLLHHLAESYSNEPEWHYFLGELFERQQLWSRAQAEYLLVLKIDPLFALANLRLGVLCETLIRLRQDCTWQAARSFYNGYYEARPNDLLAAKKLAEAERHIESMGSKPDARTTDAFDEQLFLAETLGLLPDSIALGPNLLASNSLEGPTDIESQKAQPMGWQVVQMTWPGYNNNEALFYAGLDQLNSLKGARSARMAGVWVDNDKARGPASTGFWVWDESQRTQMYFTLESGATYMLSLNYRTEWVEEDSVSVWLNSGIGQTGSLRGEHFLPSTGGAWRHVLLIGTIGEGDANASAVSPLLRLRGQGQAWFDSVQLRQVMTASTPIAQFADSPVVAIR